MTRICKRITIWLLSAVAFVALALGIAFGRPQIQKASAEDSYTLTFEMPSAREDWAESSKLSKDYLLDGTQTIGYQTEEVYTGSDAFVITETAGTTSGQAIVNTHAKGPIASWDANTKYTVSFMMKGAPFHFYFDHAGMVLLDDWVRPSTTEWTYYEYTFTPSEVKATPSRYSFLFKVAENYGKTYIDDFFIEVYEEPTTATVTTGSAIGELPALDAGKAWKIDDQIITADTVWNYTENKTATIVDTYTLTFGEEETTTREDWAESSKLGADLLTSATQTIAYQNQEVYAGSEALVITETAGTTSGQATVNTHSKGPIASWDANTKYTVSFMMKGAPFHLYFNHGKMTLMDDWVRPGEDWTYYEYTFTPNDYFVEGGTNRYSFLFKVAEANKQTYIDDFFIEEYKEPTVLPTLTVAKGCVIGELPALEEGKAWAIDGEIITAETLYNYTENKTATIVDAYTLTFEMPSAREDWAESSKLGADYLLNGTQTIAYQSTEVYSGSDAFVITAAADTTSGQAIINLHAAGPIAAWNANTKYTISFRFKGAPIRLDFDFTAAVVLDSEISPESMDWTYYEYSFTPSEVKGGAAVGRYSFLIKVLEANAKVYIDDFFIEVYEEPTTATVTTGSAIGELPVLPDGYYWTIDGAAITAETLYNYSENKVAIATKNAYYTLAFDGAEEKTVTFGEAIGELPDVPAKDGYTNGRWTIDGVAITADTVYNYDENKTAIAEYDPISYTLTFKAQEDATREDWAESSKLGTGYLINNSVHTVAYQSEEKYAGEDALVITDTAGTTSGFAIVNLHAAGPIKSWDANKKYTISFRLKGEAIHLYFNHGVGGKLLDDWVRPGEDWTYYEYTFTPNDYFVEGGTNRYSFCFKIAEKKVGAQVFIDDLFIEEYNAVLDESTVATGNAIGELPAVPEKDGYTGYWTIDGAAITAETVWSYAEDKVAVPYYNKNSSTYTVTVDGEAQTVEEGGYAAEPETPADYEDEDYTYTFDNWYIVDTDTVFDFSMAITQDYNVESRFTATAKPKMVEVAWGSGNFEPNVDGSEYTRIRLNTTAASVWTGSVNGSTIDQYLAYTKLNGRTVKEINEAAAANGCEELIKAYVRPNNASTSFYALYIPNSFTEILAEDIYTVTIEEGWQHEDSGTGNTYTNSSAVTWYFRDKTFQQNTGANKDINATANFTFGNQGDTGSGATCFILNTKDVSGLWTGTNGTMGMGNPSLNWIYINGKSIKEWNAEAKAAVAAGDATDICYGSTHAQNTNAGAPIAVRPGYANTESNGAFFQIWIANEFLPAEDIYSFEWKEGFSFMFTNTNDLYYMSESVKFENVNGAWVNSNNIYTVTVEDYNGAVLDTQRVVSGGKATAVPNPSRPMTSTAIYTFTGWKDSEGNDFDFATTTITGDVTVIAQYSEQAIQIETTEIEAVKFLYTTATDNWLIFTISNHDYTCDTGNTTYVVSQKELNRIEFLDNVILRGTIVVGTDTLEEATLAQVFAANGDGTLINFWGNGTFGLRVRKTPAYNSITEIVIKSGTHFPSYQYACAGNTEKDVRYMTLSEKVFKTVSAELGTNGQTWTTVYGTSASSYDISMADGAAIRLIQLDNFTGDASNYMETEGYKQSGIRFQTMISKETITQLQSMLGTVYDKVSFGTLIVPSADLVGGDFSHAWLDANNILYMDIKSTAWLNADGYAFADENSSYVTFYGSIVNLKAANHTRDFSGVGYIKLEKGEETTYFYAPYNESNSRSAAYIAQAAVADRSATQTDRYNNRIDENNNWSPYTVGQINFLKLYMSSLEDTEIAAQEAVTLTSTGALATVADSRNTATVTVDKKLNGAYVQLNYQTNIDVWGKFYYQNSAGTKSAVEDFYLQKGSSQHKQYLDLFRKNGVGKLAGLTSDDLYLTKIEFQNATVDKSSTGTFKFLGLYSSAKTIDTANYQVYITKTLDNDGGEMTLGAHLGLGGALTYLAKSGVYEGVTSGTYGKGSVLMRTSTESFVSQRNTSWWGSSKEAGHYGHATSSKPGDGAVNLINNYDVGRQIQQSWYANVGGTSAANTNANGYTRLQCDTGNGGYWPYNPVQAGDCNDNPSQIIDYEVNEEKGYIYVKARAMDWAYGDTSNGGVANGSTTKSYMENYYRLNTDGTVYVNNSFVDWNGFTDMDKCDFHLSELPAFIPVHTLNHFFTYDGTSPWTGGDLTMRNDLSLWTESTGKYYQSKVDGNADGTTGEEWVAWANDHLGSVALGIYIPNVTRFVSGRYETAVTTAESSNVNAYSNKLSSKGLMSNMQSILRTYQSCYVGNTSYTAPGIQLRMTAYAPIDYTYVLSVNDINTVRSQFKAIHDSGKVTNAGSQQGARVGLDAWARADKIWTQV